jgi:Semialdehyde dehydrogenase, NAD binding domain
VRVLPCALWGMREEEGGGGGGFVRAADVDVSAEGRVFVVQNPTLIACRGPQGVRRSLEPCLGATQAFSEVYPHLITATNVPKLVKIADVDFDQVDAAFCCLPHATTQEILSSLPRHVKVVDLSADFRLRDVETYAKWCEDPSVPLVPLGSPTSTFWGPPGGANSHWSAGYPCLFTFVGATWWVRTSLGVLGPPPSHFCWGDLVVALAL